MGRLSRPRRRYHGDVRAGSRRALLTAVLTVPSAACDCEPPVAGAVASDALPAVTPVGATELSYRLIAPRDGSLMLEFTRRDGRDDYAGPVFLFVTRADCASMTDQPQTLRNETAFQPQCAALADSLGFNGSCCRGQVRLANPAQVRAGQDLKVFVYGLSTPGTLPFDLTYRVGDDNCWF
jgi:hypothetical protein